MSYECIGFPEQARRQHKTVSAGTKDEVYYFPISGGFIAFIESVYASWYKNTHLEWIVDGVVVEKVERQIGEVHKLEKVSPPIVARKYIRWIAYNNDTSDHVFEIVHLGRLCKPKKH